MGMSKSLASYDDIRTALDRALESENGVRIPCGSPQAAVNLRQRCYYFRGLDREQSKKIYAAGDPRYNTSAYDTIVIQAIDTFLYLRTGVALTIEEL